MKLEDQVCSLELAKRLKDLEVKQESLFYFSKLSIQDTYQLELRRHMVSGEIVLADCTDYISAFTVAELGEMLPAIVENNYYFTSVKLYNLHHWGADYRNWETNEPFCLWDTEAETEANARAKMLIYLIENKLIEV